MSLLEERTVANRTRVEILASILKVASSQTLKTHIMYRANLSHRQLEKYLSFLEKNGMLERIIDERGTMLYQITSKGVEFLKDYAKLSGYMA